MATHYPKFYYSGHKGHGIKSDKDWVFVRLNLLNVELQKFVSRQYEDIYLYYFNKRKFRLARYYANCFLNSFIAGKIGENNKNGVDSDGEFNIDLTSRINEIRRAQKESRAQGIW